MDIKVYLPDEIGEKAIAAGLKGRWSAIFREAIEEEIMRQEAVAESLKGAEQVVLSLTDSDGRSFKGRFTGKLLADDVNGELYLKEDETLLFYRPQAETYSAVEVDELQELLSLEAYIEAMHALGEEPVIDI